MHSDQGKTYKNVMELLVAKEVHRQIEQLPPKLAQYIDRIEVATSALNRLPPLYASCKEGQRQQELRAKKQFANQINTAVRQALVAVQRDPIRLSTPLLREEEMEYRVAHSALNGLRELLQIPQLSWDNLVNMVEESLSAAAQGNLTQKRKVRVRGNVWRESPYTR